MLTSSRLGIVLNCAREVTDQLEVITVPVQAGRLLVVARQGTMLSKEELFPMVAFSPA